MHGGGGVECWAEKFMLCTHRCINQPPYLSVFYFFCMLHPLADICNPSTHTHTHTHTNHTCLCVITSATWFYLSLQQHSCVLLHACVSSRQCFIVSTTCWCHIISATWSLLIASITSLCLIASIPWSCLIHFCVT